MPDLSIIILNYNMEKYLVACLDSIKAADCKNISYETIVVDNASRDDSVKRLKTDFNWVNLIVSSKNCGFAAGNNLAIPKAKGNFILFLNPDTLIRKDTLEKCYQFMRENPKAGAMTCRVNLANGQLDEACHRGFPTPWNAFCHFSGLEKLFPKGRWFSGYTLGYKNLDTVHEIDSGTGAFLMVRKEAGKQVGWWDEDYFFYGEDLDLCYKLKQNSWKVYFFSGTNITHFRGISSGIKKHSMDISTATKEVRINSAMASTEAMRIFYKKHYQSKYPWLVNRIVNLGINLIQKKRFAKIK